MKKSTVWRLAEDRAHLTLGKLEATVRTAQPGLGLHNIRVRGKSISGARLLAPCIPGVPSPDSRIFGDCIVRGGDLIVTYAQTDERPVRLQIYWRAIPAKSAPKCLAAIDLQISVQTSQLKVSPELSITSAVPTLDVARVAVKLDASDPFLADREVTDAPADCWACSLTALGLIYGEMIHPADVARNEDAASEPGATEIRHHLFAHPLEKGVIMRARARAVFLDAARGAPAVAAVYGKFLTSPLPLTV